MKYDLSSKMASITCNLTHLGSPVIYPKLEVDAVTFDLVTIQLFKAVNSYKMVDK